MADDDLFDDDAIEAGETGEPGGADEEGSPVAVARGPVALGDGHRRGHLAILEFDAGGRPTLLEHSFVVENECHGWRLDRFLMKRMRRLSRTRIQRVIRGDLDVDGVKVTRPGQAVHAGEVVRFRRPAPPEPTVPRRLDVLC